MTHPDVAQFGQKRYRPMGVACLGLCRREPLALVLEAPGGCVEDRKDICKHVYDYTRNFTATDTEVL